MTQVLAKYAAKKILNSELEKYKDRKPAGSYDPYYTEIDHPRKPGKKKKVKKLVPDYIPEHDAIILAKMRQRAYWLDCSLFNLFGIRFGWSSVLGLIPAVGDALDLAMAFMLVLRCRKVSCGLGSSTQNRMMLNIILDFLVGLVPFIGDLADAALRANSKNVRLLEKRLDQVYKPDSVKKQEKQSGLDVLPATVYEEIDEDDDSLKLPRHRQDIELQSPAPARVPTETRGGEKTSHKNSIKKNDSRRGKRSG